MQSEAAGWVMVKLAGRLVSQAAQAPVVELVRGQFELDADGQLQLAQAPPVQSILQVAHAVLDGAIVARIHRGLLSGSTQ